MGAFPSLPEPQFVFLRSAFCLYELVSERAPLMPPEAIIQIRLEGLVEIPATVEEREALQSKDFGRCRNPTHLPFESSCWAGPAEGQADTLSSRSRGRGGRWMQGVLLRPQRTVHPFYTQVHRKLTARWASASCSHIHFPIKSL